MELRQLGYSGFQVPALTLGTGTFGGGNEFFRAWGNTGVPEATRLIDIAGVESTWLGTINGETSPESTASGEQPAA